MAYEAGIAAPAYEAILRPANLGSPYVDCVDYVACEGLYAGVYAARTTSVRLYDGVYRDAGRRL